MRRYDIHGNLPALDAVLDDIRQVGVDRIVVGVLPGPMSRETMARLLELTSRRSSFTAMETWPYSRSCGPPIQVT